MKPLDIVYWSRVGVGFFAALLCTLLQFHTLDNPFLTGLSLALILYIVSYYVFKALFAAKVEKTSKLFTMGIFIYFITWVAAWTLLNTVFFHQQG